MSSPTQSDLSAASPHAPVTPPAPRLQLGDRLTRAEFEKRYHQMPQGIKCELIEGQVYVMSSLVSADGHAVPHFDFITWLGNYVVSTPGVEGGDNATIRLDMDNEPQPDAFLRIKPSHGGQSTTSDDDYIEGAPELVAEIAASIASYDLHQKLNAYRRNSVGEYIVWRVWDQQIDWFVLRNEQFEAAQTDQSGLFKSDVFPGLWLDPAAMLSGDRGRVMEVAQQGISSPEHQQFAEELTRKANDEG